MINPELIVGETTEIEKKETLEERKPRSWLKTVSAFANGSGGVVLFGVSDDDTPVGVKDPRAISEKISEGLRDKTDPVPETKLEILFEDNKYFIVLRVIPGNETPYYYVGDGNRIAYVRIGNESVPADAFELKRLVLRGTNKTFDSLSTQEKLNDFAFTKLRSEYRRLTGKTFTESDFLSFGLSDHKGFLTNAGILFADQPPIRFSRVFCTRWFGLTKASGVMEALDDKEFSGSLITLLFNSEEFVLNNSKKRWKKTESGRLEMPEYPERSVRECIVNALIHRDYLIPGSEVHIDIFDNRLEIFSPGGMFDGTNVQNLDLENVASIRRNPVIADMFGRMHLMERRGSGFKKILDDYRNSYHYRTDLKPLFYSDPMTFRVTLWNLNYDYPIPTQSIEEDAIPYHSEIRSDYLGKPKRKPRLLQPLKNRSVRSDHPAHTETKIASSAGNYRKEG